MLQFGTSGDDYVDSLATGSGAVYVAGHTSGSFWGQTNHGGWDAFVRKYDQAGNEVWTQQFGTPAFDAAYAAAVDESGVYVGGSTTGALGSPTGTAPSTPDSFAAVGSAVFFTADDGLAGVELWRSDGTAAGTGLVSDINPGGGSYPTHLASFGSSVFFSAYEPTSGRELWTSDGTAAGTVLVKDIWPGPFNSGPTLLTDDKGTLFFIATDPTYGAELWKSDGTTAGTVLVKDINPGIGSIYPGRLVPMGSNVLERPRGRSS
ncbi:MAG: hypothetical protein E6K18_08920 [Methanobacteriota archaeon]|nr:MAG: hypothetical protein E6K18_08920 [Euryarchaeota archaeon]